MWCLGDDGDFANGFFYGIEYLIGLRRLLRSKEAKSLMRVFYLVTKQILG